MGKPVRPGYKNWEDVPSDLDWQIGEHPTGAKWIDGKPIYRSAWQGVTGAATTNVDLQASGVLETVVPGFTIMVEESPGLWRNAASLDAADMNMVVILSSGAVFLAHSATYNTTPVIVVCYYTLA